MAKYMHAHICISGLFNVLSITGAKKIGGRGKLTRNFFDLFSRPWLGYEIKISPRKMLEPLGSLDSAFEVWPHQRVTQEYIDLFME